jgi:hypothetical protein
MSDPLVTSEEVKEIISTPLTDLTAFISAAHTIVEDRLLDQGLTDTALKEIERWLAAHFVSFRSPAEKRSQKIGSAQEVYLVANLSSTGGMLKTSLYGMQAMALDTSGTLAQLGKKKAVLKVDDFREA